MTAPKKPRTAKVAPAPTAELTADQLRVVKLFAELTDHTQRQMLEIMATMAKDFPRHTRPALRLVSGGAR